MNHYTKEELVDFENQVKALWEAGELPYLIHLCGGNEDQLVSFFEIVKEGDFIFSTHRAHYHYLLSGGAREELLDKIKAGKSMFLFSRKLNFLASAIVAGNCGIAAGVAYALKRKGSKQRVWCFVGDGAEDQGHFYEAVRWVHGQNLPCVFVIEDNNLSVESPKEIRYGDGFHGWPSCVWRYYYKPAYPHAGSGCAHRIEFNRAP